MKNLYMDAIKAGQIKPFAQIIVNKKGETIGAEMLARWELPDGALLSPGRFVEEMVALNIISELDYYMFEELVKNHKAMNGYLTVNFTRQTLSQNDFAERINAILNKYDVDFSKVVVEITEVVSEDDKEVALKNVSFCKQKGVRIAVDDINTGISTLDDVDFYSPDVVKIDRVSVLKALDADDMSNIKDVLEKAHTIGAKVVAEGIETKEQAELLFSLGVDCIQGYYFGKPEPIQNLLG